MIGKWLHISVTSPKKEHFVAVFEDITERKLAEITLQESQVRLTAAMDIAGLADWEFDVASGMFTFDDRFYAFFDTTVDREGGYQMPAETYIQEFVYLETDRRYLHQSRKFL